MKKYLSAILMSIAFPIWIIAYYTHSEATDHVSFWGSILTAAILSHIITKLANKDK